MKKKKLVIASSVATALLAAASTVSSIIMSNKIMYIKKKDVNFVYERERNARRYDEEYFKNCPQEELNIESPNGYVVRGIFFKPCDTKNTVIICHGVTENKILSMKYVCMYERLGFNTVVYDLRRHGETGGKTTSYGYYEKIDLQTVVDYVREQIGEDAILGIHGESMGAATTLLYAGTIADNANFYIADCPFSSFKNMLRKVVKETVKVNFDIAVNLANLAVRLRDGYTFGKVNPIEAVKNIHKPVMFVHTRTDDFIPYTMSEELYEAKTAGPRELVLFDSGAHAQSFNEHPEAYESFVQNFLNKYVFTEKYQEGT